MTLVVDASVALKLFVGETDSADAEALYGSGEPFLAPELVLAELANALWKLARRGELAEAQFLDTVAELPLVYDELVPLGALLEASAAIAHALDHSIYDCFYLALATERGVPLVTADKRLLTRAAGSRFASLVRSL